MLATPEVFPLLPGLGVRSETVEGGTGVATRNVVGCLVGTLVAGFGTRLERDLVRLAVTLTVCDGEPVREAVRKLELEADTVIKLREGEPLTVISMTAIFFGFM